MKLRAVIIFVLFLLRLSAQQSFYVVKISDSHLKQSEVQARITVSDTNSNVIARGINSSNGSFRFRTDQSRVKITVDSTTETCEGLPTTARIQVNLDTVKDTIRIRLGHMWIDYEPRALFFENGAMTFTCFPGSTERCSFTETDTSCSGFRSLKVLEYYYRCGPFSKIEVRSFYTSHEEKKYGDSLALARASECVQWLESRGMKNVEFVVVPILYSTRPLKNSDGTIRKKEANLISFRILAW